LTVAIWAAYPEIVNQGKSVLEKVGQAPAAQQLNRPPEKGLAAPVAKASPAKTEELWSRERVEGLLTQVLGTDRMERFKKTSYYEMTIVATKNLLNVSLSGFSDKLGSFLRNVVRWVAHLFIALALSLIILIDLPRLRRKVGSLAETRIGSYYREVASVLRHFGQILGRYFQSQLFVALIERALTVAGVLFLGIP